MKSSISIIIVILISTVLSGCQMAEGLVKSYIEVRDDKFDDSNGERRPSSQQGRYEMKTVLNALSEGNVLSIKDLLCFEIQEIEDIDEQLEILLDYFDGKVVSNAYGTISKSGGREDGIWIDLTLIMQVETIVTDTGEEYSLFISSRYVDENNHDLIGLQSVILSKKDGTECSFRPLAVSIKEDYDGDQLPDTLEEKFGTRYDMPDSVGNGNSDWSSFIPDELQDKFGIIRGMATDRNDDGIPDIVDYITDYQNRDVYVMEVIDCYHTGKEFGTLYMPFDMNEDGILDDEEYEKMLQETE